MDGWTGGVLLRSGHFTPTNDLLMQLVKLEVTGALHRRLSSGVSLLFSTLVGMHQIRFLPHLPLRATTCCIELVLVRFCAETSHQKLVRPEWCISFLKLVNTS